MGKAANNERVKLRATYFNNLAIGFYVVGGVIPYVTIVAERFGDKYPGPITLDQKDYFSIGACLLAILIGGYARWRADIEIQKVRG